MKTLKLEFLINGNSEVYTFTEDDESVSKEDMHYQCINYITSIYSTAKLIRSTWDS